jgi:uncharacterized protein (DUF433 family)
VARKPPVKVPKREHARVLARVASGERRAAVAATYGVTPETVGNVIARLLNPVEFRCASCGATRTARLLPREWALDLPPISEEGPVGVSGYLCPRCKPRPPRPDRRLKVQPSEHERIRERREAGEPVSALAACYGVSVRQLRAILRRER